MATNLKELELQIDRLSESERTRLIHNLIQKLDNTQSDLSQAELDAFWVTEANRRFEAYKTGKTHADPAEDVLREMRSGT